LPYAPLKEQKCSGTRAEIAPLLQVLPLGVEMQPFPGALTALHRFLEMLLSLHVSLADKPRYYMMAMQIVLETQPSMTM